MLAFATLGLVGCGSKNSGPFQGTINFKVSGGGGMMNANGNFVCDLNAQKIRYSVDEIMGMADMGYLVDGKERVVYQLSAKHKHYAKIPMEGDDYEKMKRDLPTQKEIDEARESLKKALKPTGNKKEIAGYAVQEYEFDAEEMGERGSGKVWLAKDLLVRMMPAIEAIPEMKGLDFSFLNDYGFPMELAFEGESKMESFNFTVTGVNEGAVAGLNLDGFKEVSQEEYMNKMFEDMGLEDMFGDMDMEEMMKDLEGLEDLDLGDGENLNEMLEGLGSEIEESLGDIDLEKLKELENFFETENQK